MPRIVIVAYKPKPGKEKELDELMLQHHAVLKSENLVTNRDSIMMKAADGTVIEVLEWTSAAAIQNAHTNPVVLKMWQQYSAVCDYIPIGTVAEAANLFSEFTPF